MATFAVTLVSDQYETFDVNADSQEDAEEKALDAIEDGSAFDNNAQKDVVYVCSSGGDHWSVDRG